VPRWPGREVFGRLGAPSARRLVIPLGAAGLVAIAVGAIVGAELPATSRGANPPAQSHGAATVGQRDLVQTDTQSGTLGYASPSTVYNRVSGTITWLPAVGRVIGPGGTLYKVDNSPVVLFNGTTPAYRTLTSGVSNGPDVLELNQNLANLGFAAGEIAVNDTWQAGTTNSVARWQASLGETQTGTITLGQIIFLPGSQLVTTVSTVLGSTGGGSGASGSASGASGASSASSASSTGASFQPAAPRPQFVSLTTTTTGPTGPTGPTSATSPRTASPSSGASTAQLKALIALLKAEVSELKSAGRSSSGAGAGSSGAKAAGSSSGAGGGRSSAGASSGGGSGSGSGGSGGTGASGASGASGAGAQAQAIMQTTSTQEVVTVQLDATKQSEAVVGAPVTVQLPDGSSSSGRITRVSPVAQSSSSSSSSGAGGGAAAGGASSSSPAATIPVTVALTGHTRLSGLDQAAVSVNFVQQRATGVLSVPVTALIATQGGGYSVQVATSPHRLIHVTVGLFAAGYVQISGAGIYPGLQVTDSQG
jgi:hypothetical protein